MCEDAEREVFEAVRRRVLDECQDAVVQRRHAATLARHGARQTRFETGHVIDAILGET